MHVESSIMNPDDQKRYWNAISSEYRRVTRIDAGDFHYGPRIAGESKLRLLPKPYPGMNALELGCGGAQNSIWLARQGVDCSAVDISEAQLACAKQDAQIAGVTLNLFCSSLEAFESIETFDWVHSSHAMEFVADPLSILYKMVRWLKPGGTLMISTVHPIYNGEWFYAEDADDESKGTWGRFIPNYFYPVADVREQPDGVGEPIVSRAWPIGQWFAWIKQSGLVLESLLEPQADPESAYSSDAWEDDDGEAEAIPTTLILVAKKPL